MVILNQQALMSEPATPAKEAAKPTAAGEQKPGKK